jgi:hypothetical protein
VYCGRRRGKRPLPADDSRRPSSDHYRMPKLNWLAKRRSALAEEFHESYVRWQQACDDVRTAYRRWANATSQQSALEFATYCVALDLEERAAEMYCKRAAQVGTDQR